MNRANSVLKVLTNPVINTYSEPFPNHFAKHSAMSKFANSLSFSFVTITRMLTIFPVLFFYRKVAFSEVRNDTEPNTRGYVRVLDPKAAEISFVRTTCEKKQALYVSCSNLGLLLFHFFHFVSLS